MGCILSNSSEILLQNYFACVSNNIFVENCKCYQPEPVLSNEWMYNAHYKYQKPINSGFARNILKWNFEIDAKYYTLKTNSQNSWANSLRHPWVIAFKEQSLTDVAKF
jgi:hypothetical protein